MTSLTMPDSFAAQSKKGLVLGVDGLPHFAAADDEVAGRLHGLIMNQQSSLH
jgi:hypothetical protein